MTMANTARDLDALRAVRSAKMERDMATSPTLAVPQKQLEDPLAHLPCSSILEYRKGQVIYNQDQPSISIYLVIDGKVKVCRMADDGRQVVVDIYQTDEFFGESAFLSSPTRSWSNVRWSLATASRVSRWTTSPGVWRAL